MKLILIRHGETTANTKSVILGGKEGGELSERGKRQAKSLGARFSKEKFAEVYCSPSNRARQTCAAVIEGRGVEASIFDGLREMEMGDLVGLSHEEAEEKYPNVFNDMFAEPRRRIPGGESIQDVMERAMPLFQELAGRPGNPTVLAVGHNVVNRIILASLLGLPLDKAKSIKQKNCCFSVLDVKPGFSQLYTLDNSVHGIK